jgi:hypothetical protein
MVPPPLPLALCALSELFTLSQSFVAVHHRLQMVWTHAMHGRCFKGKGRVAKGMIGAVIVAAQAEPSAPPLLMAPIDTPYLMFGAVEGLDMGDRRLVKCPAWVEPALALDSPSAAQLVGEEILYKWPPRLGGWARGTVSAVNKDKTKKVAKEVCKFTVLYRDTSMHFLTEHA